ncbi:hypothetical protein KIN20_034777 [Parelaphostrongylus tenuis]|uniref:Uncharacterized protein n=1 Tax=Parelaphostrongylus tenuis TaxID=148309 RepID=A0AAD5RAM8_PARTN|nr:hypothetical protein KIN20_015046 [Parelaphostrongylus tenuis]KAJ1372586.1 hypothetical protein KIN20_034777 [Parelaphostrongylus tenuis]
MATRDCGRVGFGPMWAATIIATTRQRARLLQLKEVLGLTCSGWLNKSMRAVRTE